MEHAHAEANPWSLGASLSWYFVHDRQNFGVVTATADHGPVHLEARYNYEALKTGSAFVGWNFEFGETVTFGITPIVGCMFGDVGGPILGLELALGWGPLSFSSQAEWVTDVQEDTGGFVYVWSELDVRPWRWLRAGMVVQRTPRVPHRAGGGVRAAARRERVEARPDRVLVPARRHRPVLRGSDRRELLRARFRRGERRRRGAGADVRQELVPHHVAPRDEREAECREIGETGPEQELGRAVHEPELLHQHHHEVPGEGGEQPQAHDAALHPDRSLGVGELEAGDGDRGSPTAVSTT